MTEVKKSSGNNVVYAAILWAVTYIGCLLVLKEMNPEKHVGIVLSFLPTIAFVIFIYNYIKAVAGMDEVERRIQLEATGIAFTLGLLMIMTLGLLDLVVVLKKEDWGYGHLIPYFFIFYLIGIIYSRRKYL